MSAVGENESPSEPPVGALGRIARAAFKLQLLGSVALLALLPVLLPSSSEKHRRTRCANNLRQLGLAATQYAQDKRFFPQVGPVERFQGGSRPLSSTKTVRTLIWYGYHHAPESLVCPSSNDEAYRWSGKEPKRWFWGGEHQRGDPERDPASDGLPDPPLKMTRELSYGWSRVIFGPNAPATTPVAADRAIRYRSRDPENLKPGEVGNHWDGLFVLQVDGTVTWQTKEKDRELPPGITDLDVLYRDLQRTPHAPPPRGFLERYWPGLVLFGWIAVLGLLFWLGRRELAHTPS